MKLEDDFCDVQYSKRLIELGVNEQTVHFWANTIGQTDQSCWRIEPKTQDSMMEYFPAFSTAHLGLMLWHIGHEQEPPVYKTKGVWGRRILQTEKEPLGLWVEDKKEANARAIMLIKLIEKGQFIETR